MDLAALSMLVFGVLITSMGMTGLMAPHFLLEILDFSSSPTVQIFLMASSQASFAMGLYYILAALHDVRAFYGWSVILRIINFYVFTRMVVSGVAPPKWLMVASLELSGALATGIALTLKNKEVALNRFNTMRMVSVILALLGAILAFIPFGVYGSASAFLVISSAGFIYAYRELASPLDLKR